MDEQMKLDEKDAVAAMVSASAAGNVSVFDTLGASGVDVAAKSGVVPIVGNLTFDSVFDDDKIPEAMDGSSAADMAMDGSAAAAMAMDGSTAAAMAMDGSTAAAMAMDGSTAAAMAMDRATAAMTMDGSTAAMAMDGSTASAMAMDRATAAMTMDGSTAAMAMDGSTAAAMAMDGSTAAAMAMGIGGGGAGGDVMDTMMPLASQDAVSMAQSWSGTGMGMTVAETMATQSAVAAAVASAMATEQSTAISNHTNLAPLNLSGISNNTAAGAGVGVDIATAAAASGAGAGAGAVSGAGAVDQQSPDAVTAAGPRPSFKQWTFQEQFKQLYEISEEPERRDFLDELFDFMQKRGSPVSRIPIMAKVTLDLFRLFTEVCNRGGLIEVINKKMWRDIANTLGIPTSITSAAFTLRTQYSKYLYPYECETKHFSSPEELELLDATRRSQSASTPQTPNTPGVRVYSLDPAALAMASTLPYALEPTPKRSLIGSSSMATSIALPIVSSCTSYMNLRAQQVMATGVTDSSGSMTAEDGSGGELPSMFVSMEINGMVYQGTLYGRAPMVATVTPPIVSTTAPSMVGMVTPVVSLPQVPTTDASNGAVTLSDRVATGNGMSATAGNGVVVQATVPGVEYAPHVAQQVSALDSDAVAAVVAAAAAAEVAMIEPALPGQQGAPL